MKNYKIKMNNSITKMKNYLKIEKNLMQSGMKLRKWFKNLKLFIKNLRNKRKQVIIKRMKWRDLTQKLQLLLQKNWHLKKNLIELKDFIGGYKEISKNKEPIMI